MATPDAPAAISEADLRPHVEKIVRDVLRELSRARSMRIRSLVGPAEERWGYRVGVDGVVSAEEAMRRLAVTTDRTLRNYQSRGYIRVGYRQPGKPNSGVVVCARSLRDHLAGCEQ